MNHMRFQNNKALFLGLVFVFILILFPLPSSAADGSLHLVTSPLPINLVTTPGSSVTTPIKIKNGGTQTEQLKITLMKFKAYESNGQPQLMDPEPTDDFLTWASFSEDTFTAAPDEWKTITATFNVPQDAAFGYYYAIVFSRAHDEIPTDSKQTAVVGGTAVLVLLEARVDDAKRSVEVTEFSTDKQIYEFLPATFTVKLKNTGSVHVAPRGNIFINKGDEHDVALLEINANKGNILPNSTRDFKEPWKDAFPVYVEKKQDGKVVLDEAGNQVMELVWDFGQASKLRWGKYTAKMLLIYDDGHRDVPIEGEVSFWVVPWRLIGVGLFILVFVLIGLKNTLQNMWKNVHGWFEKK
ncbi:MAG: hypothetical protein PHT88_03445 [Candidatus Moranbacteria bacterium]|nr:hypothetical protein [Candidatus Moranbacteria bacterium]